jgi:hypothetical protein
MFLSAAHRFATWVCLVATLLLGAAPARGLVLCVGADGHIALEASTADAACFDCPSESASEDACCADPAVGDSGCTCTDTLLLASEKAPVRSIVTERIGDLPAACVLVKPESDVAAALLRPFELRARTQPPPCARVPALLVLRV